MRIKNLSLFIGILLLISIFILQNVSAINLRIEKEGITTTVIKELSDAAKFKLTITNLGNNDNFQIYSLVGMDITPQEPFFLSSNETKILTVDVLPEEALRKKTEGSFPFVFKIKGQNNDIQEDSLIIKFARFEDSFESGMENINPDAASVKISIKNKENFEFTDLKVNAYSAFFDIEKEISLKAYERIEFEVPLNREKLKTTVAGSYMLALTVKKGDVATKKESYFKLLEKSGISTNLKSEGLIIRKKTIEKINEGNLPSIAEIQIKKDIISRLFSTFSPEPDKIERRGFFVYYNWQKELKPVESMKIIVRTNWLFPLLLLFLVIVILIFVKIYTKSNLLLDKKVNFVRTKSGEFALKVSILIKANKFVEKVRIIDKLPQIVKLYEGHGVTPPDKIDEKNRRVGWDIESLDAGERRIFSYIVYSKIAPIGRFELPRTLAIFEKEGKIHEVESNKVFFLNEQRKEIED